MFRDTVVTSYFRSDNSIAEVARDYGVNEGTVGSWINKYRDEHEADFSISEDITTFAVANKETNQMKKEKLSPEQMTKRIAELEAKLAHEHMHRIVLDTMIDIAERDFNIPIRKKDGAKQCK